eukprot:975489-Lingulodinium_polyedra.AAC.1
MGPERRRAAGLAVREVPLFPRPGGQAAERRRRAMAGCGFGALLGRRPARPWLAARHRRGF